MARSRNGRDPTTSPCSANLSNPAANSRYAAYFGAGDWLERDDRATCLHVADLQLEHERVAAKCDAARGHEPGMRRVRQTLQTVGTSASAISQSHEHDVRRHDIDRAVLRD